MIYKLVMDYSKNFLYNKFVKIEGKNMLPVISEEISAATFSEIFKDMPAWRKKMIYYLKEENPEINTAIIEAANQTDLDPKAVALGAYMTYALVERAMQDNDSLMNFQEG